MKFISKDIFNTYLKARKAKDFSEKCFLYSNKLFSKKGGKAFDNYL